ncbi:hypothetical protein B0O80DRAFT_429415 [Mortierella sp. GBAus27b]|nr:hypothetical protein B0O80DRAFT_429415 [Mortierella sp. GBAus27b]
MAAQPSASVATKGISAPFALSDVHLIRALSPEIIQRTWTNNKVEWGKTIDIETYFGREKHLAKQEFAQHDRMKTWVLVPKSFDPDHPNLDHILCAVETFERPGLVATKDQGVRDVLSVSIASVFCAAPYRGHGYATVMMKQLWKEIENMQGVEFTFLYSDVGPDFYGRLGWTPRPSDELIIPPSYSWIDQDPPRKDQDPTLVGDDAAAAAAVLQEVTDDNLEALVAQDAQWLRNSMEAQLDADDQVLVAVTPDIHCIQWLSARSRFLADHVPSSPPPPPPPSHDHPPQQSLKVLGVRDTQSHSFVLWYHNLAGGTFYVIRWQLDPAAKNKDRVARALIQAIQDEAKKWNRTKVTLWNPDPALANQLALTITPRASSISCLGFVSPASALNAKNVEWLLNEKYAWC